MDSVTPRKKPYGAAIYVLISRSRYRVPRIKNLVKAVVNSFKVCVIHKKRLQVQMMGSFPKERVSFSRPFTYTEMDYAGPFEIKKNIPEELVSFQNGMCWVSFVFLHRPSI